MRKLLLSGIVVGLFILYGLQKQEGGQNTEIIVPQSQQQMVTSMPLSSTQGNASAPPPPTPTPAQSSGSSNPPAQQQGQYKDGSYTGSVADAYYGYVQVQATISGGRISNVTFLQYPNTHNTSIMINQQAMPYLQQEAIQAQNANVNIVSGATDTSMAFQQSLQAALSQAH
ncbi:MAG TPA: FMN-binding protein [Candidatus Acidoferrales bacterium]|nr:FMN-binding protein [Candidatus Acidoferrales bacterium]